MCLRPQNSTDRSLQGVQISNTSTGLRTRTESLSYELGRSGSRAASLLLKRLSGRHGSPCPTNTHISQPQLLIYSRYRFRIKSCTRSYPPSWHGVIKASQAPTTSLWEAVVDLAEAIQHLQLMMEATILLSRQQVCPMATNADVVQIDVRFTRTSR